MSITFETKTGFAHNTLGRENFEIIFTFAQSNPHVEVSEVTVDI